MNEIFNKLTSYNIFNCLLPGIIFSIIFEKLTYIKISQSNAIIDLFVYYFLGMTIGRFGSLFIEPLLKKMSIIKIFDYNKYIKAEENDKKISLLLEVSNTYRTIFALLFITLIISIIKYSQSMALNIGKVVIILFFSVIFLFSYRKQTDYINKRIDMYNKEEEK